MLTMLVKQTENTFETKEKQNARIRRFLHLYGFAEINNSPLPCEYGRGELFVTFIIRNETSKNTDR